MPISVGSFGADNTGATDSSAAFQSAVDSIVSYPDVYNGFGGKINIPPGRYRIDKTINIRKSNIYFEGENMRAVYLFSTMTDGSPVFNFDTGTGTKLTSIGIRDVMIDGQNNNTIGVRMKDCSVTRFYNLFIDKCRNHGLYLEECYDAVFDQCFFRGSGNLATGKHAVFMYNGIRDNCNRILFDVCTFEANHGSHFYSDSTGNIRKNGQNKFIGVKFHGLDPLALPGNNPATPAIYLEGDANYIISCMFFQVHDDTIVIKGDRNKVVACEFYNSTKNFVNIVSGQYNVVRACAGQYHGVGYYPVELGSASSETFADFAAGTETRKIRIGSQSIGDDGGRLALWNNMYRQGSDKRQIKGTLPSYGLNVAANNSDGVAIYGVDALGTDNAVVATQTILNATINTVTVKKPVIMDTNTYLQLGYSSVPAPGTTLQAGMMFFDRGANTIKVYNGTVWKAVTLV